uniref:Uncharacterized protein LOC100175501 n=1 Tax=Phallusia mammillata TaxID=59560 RepID=A0A6F9DH63_9ASCI|nr:uncharacterized protein LOC100175501 [Phallusia mammillata]
MTIALRGCLYLALLCSVISLVQGLRCWQCSGRSEKECLETGKLITCVNEQDVCATTVRRYYSVSRVFKQCKQKQSCFNDRKQNWNKYGTRHRCNNNLPSSVCYCCCDDDSCNVRSCTATITAKTCEVHSKNLENGRVYCTNSNKVGSQCYHSCTKSGYYLNPSDSTTLQCMGNGQWSKKAPCCARPCPPYAPFDLVFVLNRHQPDARKMLLRSFWWLFRSMWWSADPEYYRSSRVVYSSIVHPETYISLNETWIIGTAGESVLPPRDEIVNTGAALRFVRDHVFTTDHRDVMHMDVILLVIDENSHDDVREVAKELRDDGVIIYVMFQSLNHEPNMQELMDITGERDHIFILHGQMEGIGNKFATEIMGHLCDNVCDLTAHTHDD